MTGPVMLSGHPDYDGARTIWNGMHDKRPALIARCMNSEDVSNAVTFAGERDLLLAGRGGGHSWPGKSICDDGLMIDLSQLTNVSIDLETPCAQVGGGGNFGAVTKFEFQLHPFDRTFCRAALSGRTIRLGMFSNFTLNGQPAYPTRCTSGQRPRLRRMACASS